MPKPYEPTLSEQPMATRGDLDLPLAPRTIIRHPNLSEDMTLLSVGSSNWGAQGALGDRSPRGNPRDNCDRVRIPAGADQRSWVIPITNPCLIAISIPA